MTTPPSKPPFSSDDGSHDDYESDADQHVHPEPRQPVPLQPEPRGKIISRRAADLIRSAATVKETINPRTEPIVSIPPLGKAPTPGERANHPLYQVAPPAKEEDDDGYAYRDPLDVLDEEEHIPAPVIPSVAAQPLRPSMTQPEEDDDMYVSLDSPPEEDPEPQGVLPPQPPTTFIVPTPELKPEPDLAPPTGLDFLEQLDLSPPGELLGDSHEGESSAPAPPSSSAQSSAARVAPGPEQQGVRAPGAPIRPGQPTQKSKLAERDPNALITNDALSEDEIVFNEEDIATAESLGVTVNKQYVTEYVPEKVGFDYVGTPENLSSKLRKVGYQCLDFIAVQIGLILNTPTTRIRAMILEGPTGCGKSFMAKSLAKITGAELMTLSCYKGMRTENLVEYPSTLAMAHAMTGKGGESAPEMLKLGVISRAFLRSQEKPVILLIDELDKPDGSIDTFFLGPIQDARIWLESRPPVDANIHNLLILFTKNFNRPIDEALLRRCHPVKMTYLDSTLERRILSPHCDAQLVANLVAIADKMRNSSGSYQFERPPAPEELLTAAHYIKQLLDWNITDFAFVGRNLWAMLAKSEHDRAVLDHMLRFHPDYMDPLFLDARHAPQDVVYARFGRIVLDKIVSDPDSLKREKAWKELEYN